MSVPENESNDLEDPQNKPVYFFGKDIREIKCFRNSIFFGLYTGIGMGLGTFMWTSKVKFSINMGLFSIWFGLFFYWVPCRYKYETSLIEIEAFKERMKKHIEEGKKIKENTS